MNDLDAINNIAGMLSGTGAYSHVRAGYRPEDGLHTADDYPRAWVYLTQWQEEKLDLETFKRTCWFEVAITHHCLTGDDETDLQVLADSAVDLLRDLDMRFEGATLTLQVPALSRAGTGARMDGAGRFAPDEAWEGNPELTVTINGRFGYLKARSQGDPGSLQGSTKLQKGGAYFAPHYFASHYFAPHYFGLA
jgi:hypothetical protein